MPMSIFTSISHWGQVSIAVTYTGIPELELSAKELDLPARNISRGFQFRGMEIKSQ